MQKLEKYVKLLNEIMDTCEEIIRRSVPVMKSIMNDKDKIISTIKKKSDLDEKDIKIKLHQEGLNLVKDAKAVKKDIDEFCLAIIGQKSFKEINAPFLLEVWYGDLYDATGFDAFEALLADLKHQMKQCDIENLIAKI